MAHDIDEGPTYESAIASLNALAETGKKPSLEQETALRSAIDKLFGQAGDELPWQDDGDEDADDGGE